jgi:hypothetical protein
VPQTLGPVPIFHQIDDTLYTAPARTFLGQV